MAPSSPAVPAAEKRSARTLIIGTGFGGLAAAIRLKQQDADFIILERATEVGGVWRDNGYPGCGCDVQSHLYSYSFAPNPSWSRQFSLQPEIWAYLRRCAAEFGLLGHVSFGTNVDRLSWDDRRGEWVASTNRGEFRGRYVFAGMGSLSDPMIPEVAGLDSFKGQVIHSARWPKDLELEGKSVAVIGTGASAIQYIPKIQPLVGALHVYQRTAHWVVERHDFAISEGTRRLFARFPLLQRLARFRLYLLHELFGFGFRNPWLMRMAQKRALEHLHKAVQDPERRRKLTPNYTLGCKRVLISNDYYPAMAQSNVDIVTAGIRQVTECGIVDRNGVERPADLIIFGTGFQVRDLPYSHWILGRGGVSLAKAWNGSPTSLNGTTVHGFPNLFILHGPNTGLGYNSVIYMLETQVEHSLRLMQHAERSGSAIVEPRAEAQRRYTAMLDRMMKGTVWTAGGCDSWYLDQTGRNSQLWPSHTFTFRNRAVNFRPADYHFRKLPNPLPA